MNNIVSYPCKTTPMKPLLSLLMLVATIAGFSQDTARTLTFKQVGWTFTLPSGFTQLTTAEDAAHTERGKQLLEKSSGIEVDASATVTLFSAGKDKYNYLNSTLTRFDPKVDGDYKENVVQLKELMFNTFKDNMPDAVIDSASSSTVIDGLKFDKFRISVTINKKKIFTSYLLSRLHKGYDHGISYLCLDDKTLRDVEDALNRSRFVK